MTETNATSEYRCMCQSWQNEIAKCGDPTEIARKVKLAFKRLPGDVALAYFAKLITADLPHILKVAIWDTVRYSHIWWYVDEVLKGPVMENPVVQRAFADAVPMRRYHVENHLPGWEITKMTVDLHIGSYGVMTSYSLLQKLIYGIVSCEDALAARCVIGNSTPEFDKQIRTFVDHNGNNLLWYLTYRYDRNPPGGFACPFTVAALLDKGVNPNHLNNLGLCWNDVSKHVVRPEM